MTCTAGRQIQGFFGPETPCDNLDRSVVALPYFASAALGLAPASTAVVSPNAGGVYYCCDAHVHDVVGFDVDTRLPTIATRCCMANDDAGTCGADDECRSDFVCADRVTCVDIKCLGMAVRRGEERVHCINKFDVDGWGCDILYDRVCLHCKCFYAHCAKCTMFNLHRLKQHEATNQTQMDQLGDVDGCDCIIVGCMIKAGAELKKRDAKKYVFAAHGLFSGPAIERFALSFVFSVCESSNSVCSL